MGRILYRRKPLVFIVIGFLIFTGMQFVFNNVTPVWTNKLSDGSTEVLITFESAGIDSTSLALEVPVDASILTASLDVTGMPYNGQYPDEVTVNIGNDEDTEWEFKGTGYGALGYQTYFSNGAPNAFMKFHNTSFINNVEIMLPKNATIKSTSLTLEGGTGNYAETYVATVNYYGQIYYIKSNGNSFLPPSLVDDIGSYCYGICTGDFDNDGDLDIITGDSSGWGGTSTMYFYEKEGPGNDFAAKVNIGSFNGGGYVMDIAAGDYNNDGNIDFIVSGYSSSLFFFAGDGTGAFTSNQISATGAPTMCLGKDAGDFNNDGNLDFVTGGSTSGAVFYYQGLGNGAFNNAVSVTMTGVGSYQYSVIADDFDNDGNIDILSCDSDGELYVVEGDGKGSFGSAKKTNIDAGSYSPGDAYDFNFDGRSDVVAIYPYASPGSEVFIYRGMGSSTTFETEISLGHVGTSCFCVACPPPKLIGAENATLDVGDVGTGYDWTYSGILEDAELHVSDFTTKLNGLLDSSAYRTKRDFYGNDFVYIPLNFTSDNDGLLRATSFSIEYSYTATIHQVGLDSIVSELNEHIVYTSADSIKLRFIVSSSSAGKLKFNNLDLLYNIPPDFNSKISPIIAYEDTPNLNLKDLSDFFSDTDEPTTDLNYSVVYNSQSEHVDVFTNFTNILKFRPITPNWYGETDVMVQVIDSGFKKSYSNLFKIVVQPVNDEPTIKHQIPDVTLIEGGKEFSLDLDLREYFTDIENDYLYYSLTIDPMNYLTDEQKNIKAYLEDNTIIKMNGIGDFNTYDKSVNIPIPIWVYCDDDIDINTIANGAKNYTRQEILVTILPVNDPPQWQSIPTVYVEEDNVADVNLHDYLTDDESPLSELSIQVISNPNPSIKVDITGGQMSVQAPNDYYGSTIITLRASESNPEFFADTAVDIIITPVNDEPTIAITSHQTDDPFKETEIIKGTVDDVEGNIQLVEVKIDAIFGSPDAPHFDWQQAILDRNLNEWTYVWDTTTVPDGEYMLTARVYDGELMNETGMKLSVENGKNIEPVVDISNPPEDAIVNGSVVIKGTVYDPDNNGINDLRIRIGREMDWTKIYLEEENGTIDWFYVWESTQVSDGPIVISAKAFDGRSWSAPLNVEVDVKNGINGTPSKNLVSESQGHEIDMLWLGIIIMIVIVIIIGLMVVAVIVSKGKKRMQQYIPDGRMVPLEDVEAQLRPTLGVGPVTAPHAALPAVGTTASPYGVAALPAVGVTTITPTAPTLPSATQPMATAIPALPPAGGSSGGYGLYSPQAQTTQPVSVSPTGGYQPKTNENSTEK